jgi:hypothetical protein
MRQIADNFNSDIAYLDEWTLPGNGSGTWIDDNKHVDLRSFINYDIERLRSQAELDQYTQEALEEAPFITQRNLRYAISVSGEYWSVTGTGFVNSYDWDNPPGPIPAGAPFVGIMSEGWRGMELTTTTAAVAVDLISSIPYDAGRPDTAGIDVSSGALGAGAALSIVMRGDLNRASYTAASSYVQLSSAADGGFGSAADCTAQIPFTSNTSGVNTELRIPMTSMVSGAGAAFDPSKVRGVKIHLVKGSGSAGQKLRIQGIRVVGSAWTVKDLDMETRRGILVAPVPLDGVTYTGTKTTIVRGTTGNTDGEDNLFVDGTLQTFFSPGGARSLSASPSQVGIMFREYDNSSIDYGWFMAVVTWQQVGGDLHLLRMVNGTVTTIGTVSIASLDRPTDEDLNEPSGIDSEQGRYCLQVTALGSNFELRLFESTSQDEINGSAIAVLDVTDTRLVTRRGRTGLYFAAADHDSFIDQFEAGVVGYATVRTEVMESYTPADGAQLTASFSEDANLFTEFIWLEPDEIFVDNTKTLSGLGSFRSKSGVMANQFLVEDWNETRVEFDIWVPSTFNSANQPTIVMRAADLDESGDEILLFIPLPSLRANQWNHVNIDLARFANQNPGLFYTLTIQPKEPGAGYFWIDNMRIARRQVEWSFRTGPDFPWRSFRDMVNDEHKALQLPISERGRMIQLQGIALTPDAWIAHTRLLPRYARLGLPLYDQGFQTT